MRWPWSQVEERQASYSNAVIQTILREAGQPIPAQASATGALELAAGAVGRAFAVADVQSASPLVDLLDAPTMTLIGRELIRSGELVLLLDVGRRELTNAATFDVWGGAAPESWVYRADLSGPSGTASTWVPGSGLFHFRYATRPESPWRGIGPLQVARQAGRLSAEVETALADESSGPRGALLPTPKDGDDDTIADIRASIKKAAGRIVTVETSAGNWGDGGRANAPREDWQTNRFGADPPMPLVSLNSEAAKGVLGACGVPVELLTGGDGTGQREAWRRFLFGTVGPLGKLVAAELTRKLEVPVSIEWDELRASDLQGRARAVGSLVKAGASLESAASAAGLEALEVQQGPVSVNAGQPSGNQADSEHGNDA